MNIFQTLVEEFQQLGASKNEALILTNQLDKAFLIDCSKKELERVANDVWEAEKAVREAIGD